jgi:hypothetical protein
MNGESILASMAAWLSTSAVFIGIPVIRALRADVRAAEASGVADPKAVLRRRFFIPRGNRPLHASVLHKTAWVERYAAPAHEKRALRVTAVRTGSLQFEDGSVFEPRTMSPKFAGGAGAAKGVLRDERGIAPALVVFV